MNKGDLKKIESDIEVGAKYKHSKSGKEYGVVALARHSETLEELVVYRALYGEHDVWVRPIAMFEEKVLVNGEMVARFVVVK
jgi:hypothetical protein